MLFRVEWRAGANAGALYETAEIRSEGFSPRQMQGLFNSGLSGSLEHPRTQRDHETRKWAILPGELPINPFQFSLPRMESQHGPVTVGYR